MPKHTVALSCYDPAFDESRVIFVEVTAETQEVALRDIERRRHDREWVKALLGHEAHDHDECVDGIRIDNWQVVPGASA